MQLIKHTLKAAISAEVIWNFWESVNTWNLWDQGVEFCKLFGAFESGVKGELKPKGGPLAKIQLTCVEPKSKFVIESVVMGVKIIFSHLMEEENGQLSLTHTVEMSGMMAPLLAGTLGNQIKKNLPSAMNTLIELAKEKEAMSGSTDC